MKQNVLLLFNKNIEIISNECHKWGRDEENMNWKFCKCGCFNDQRMIRLKRIEGGGDAKKWALRTRTGNNTTISHKCNTIPAHLFLIIISFATIRIQFRQTFIIYLIKCKTNVNERHQTKWSNNNNWQQCPTKVSIFENDGWAIWRQR